jgi:hypothetical protein
LSGNINRIKKNTETMKEFGLERNRGNLTRLLLHPLSPNWRPELAQGDWVAIGPAASSLALAARTMVAETLHQTHCARVVVFMKCYLALLAMDAGGSVDESAGCEVHSSPKAQKNQKKV